MKYLCILLAFITLNYVNAQSNDSITSFPDVEAQFPGGPEGMKTYLMENTEYPKLAQQLGEEGKVYVKFVVERDGSLSNFEIIRSSGSKTLDAEALRVVKNMPDWTPAEKDGEKVRSVCRFPINFTLGKEKKKKRRRR
ncbi:protein TonB [Lishizhenia tianjinensis]|uniref:Protein TonB n=1 Tax=Lishizhenia tianjinensis TaxID=477690 RepID=A0A1I7BXC1_9FLAO|nr:energy transducer TonB [Lishizhenia tianjinensis]SFT91824.1 protein TonB [Lishizhenia tianjinensis]